MNIRTSTNTRLSAVYFNNGEGGVNIRVYYQGKYRMSLKHRSFIEMARRARVSGYRGIAT